jgi:hypothetical protein
VIVPSNNPLQLIFVPPGKVPAVKVGSSGSGSVNVIDVSVEHPLASVIVTE